MKSLIKYLFTLLVICNVVIADEFKVSKPNLQLLEGNQARYDIRLPGQNNITSIEFIIEIDTFTKKLFERFRFGYTCEEDQKTEGLDGAGLLFESELKETKHKIKCTGKQEILPASNEISPAIKDGKITFKLISPKNIDSLWVVFAVHDDEEYKGIKSFEITNSLRVFKSDDRVELLAPQKVKVTILDDDDKVVCASLISLDTNCFDVHVGLRGTFDIDGKLKTEPYYHFLSRTKFSGSFEGMFEAEYYQLPELDSNSDNENMINDSNITNPFSKSTGMFKLTYTGYYDLGKRFSLFANYGARKVPQSLFRENEVTQFTSLGIQHESFFGLQKGRGLSGFSFSKDEYWNFCEGASDTVEDISCSLSDADSSSDLVFNNYENRIKLFGTIALNKKGSVMLTTYMDFHKRGNGPAEVGISLTYGGKWSELLSDF